MRRSPLFRGKPSVATMVIPRKDLSITGSSFATRGTAGGAGVEGVGSAEALLGQGVHRKGYMWEKSWDRITKRSCPRRNTTLGSKRSTKRSTKSSIEYTYTLFYETREEAKGKPAFKRKWAEHQPVQDTGQKKPEENQAKISPFFWVTPFTTPGSL